MKFYSFALWGGMIQVRTVALNTDNLPTLYPSKGQLCPKYVCMCEMWCNASSPSGLGEICVVSEAHYFMFRLAASPDSFNIRKAY